MKYIKDGMEIIGQFECDGMTYPSNWLELAPESELENIGIVKLTEIYPTISETQYYDGTYIDDMIKKTRTYNFVNIISQPIVIDTISLWKLRSILSTRNLIDTINNIIKSLDEPYKTYASNGFEYALTIDRNSSMILMIQKALNMSDSEVDDIFIAANNIPA
jgi:hypothetical protein